MITTSGTDDLLRKMFANMQEQLVQGNTIVMQVTQQNAKLSQEIVELKNEIETIKGADKNEDAVSEV
jgi:cell division protein FtsB